MTLRNLMMTFDEGRTRTWRLPRRSALTMLFWIRDEHYSTDTHKITHQAVVKHRDANHDGRRGEAERRLWRQNNGGVSKLEYARPSVVLQKARVKTSYITVRDGERISSSAVCCNTGHIEEASFTLRRLEEAATAATKGGPGTSTVQRLLSQFP